MIGQFEQERVHGVKDSLIRARARIADPEHWTQGVVARGKSGRSVRPRGKAACKWCAVGAVVKEVSYFSAQTRCISALSAVCGTLLGTFNDTHTHAEVLALFDAAIAAQED